MYVCMYVYIYVYICALCMYVCMYVCMYARMYVCMCVCIHYIYIYIHVLYVPAPARCGSVGSSRYVEPCDLRLYRTHLCVHIYIYIYICDYMHMMYVYIYIYILCHKQCVRSFQSVPSAFQFGITMRVGSRAVTPGMFVETAIDAANNDSEAKIQEPRATPHKHHKYWGARRVRSDSRSDPNGVAASFPWGSLSLIVFVLSICQIIRPIHF